MATASHGSSTNWSSANNAKVSDSSYATAAWVVGSKPTYYLKATNFGFAIPAGATINGIVAEIQEKSSVDTTSDYCSESHVVIIKSDGTLGTTDKKVAGHISVTESYVSHGGTTDLWDVVWTAEDINDVDFGFAFVGALTSVEDTVTVSVNHMRVTVYYTEAAGGGVPKHQDYYSRMRRA
jgi:hypothetical protein